MGKLRISSGTDDVTMKSLSYMAPVVDEIQETNTAAAYAYIKDNVTRKK